MFIILLGEGVLRLIQIIGDRKRGIEPLLPESKSTCWAGVRTGRFPKGVKFGSHLTVWRKFDIRQWLETELGRRESKLKCRQIATLTQGLMHRGGATGMDLYPPLIIVISLLGIFYVSFSLMSIFKIGIGGI